MPQMRLQCSRKYCCSSITSMNHIQHSHHSYIPITATYPLLCFASSFGSVNTKRMDNQSLAKFHDQEVVSYFITYTIINSLKSVLNHYLNKMKTFSISHSKIKLVSLLMTLLMSNSFSTLPFPLQA